MPILALAAVVVLEPMVRAEDPPRIHLDVIDGRSWLVAPDGQPFFAHGVTHVGGNHGVDVEAIGEACRNLGFNAYGYGCPEELKADLPYLEGRNNLVPMSLYRGADGGFRYVDIFDPEERSRLEADIEKVCVANRENQNLIGYCWTDLAAWPLENATGKNWVDFIRNLPDGAPGLVAYEEFLSGWKGGDPGERDLAFLRLIARNYFRVLGEANRRFDPDHIVFGDRYSFSTVVPEVVEEMLPYVDAIAVQPRFNGGFPRREFDRLHRLTGKPIVICDFAIRFQEKGENIRGWKPEKGPKEAGEVYAEYVREAFATPYIIGVFWCNPINSKPGFKKAGIKQGLFGQGLSARPDLNRAILELNAFIEQETPRR